MTMNVKIEITDQPNEDNKDYYISLVSPSDPRPIVVRPGESKTFTIWKSKTYTITEDNTPIIEVK